MNYLYEHPTTWLNVITISLVIYTWRAVRSTQRMNEKTRLLIHTHLQRPDF